MSVERIVEPSEENEEFHNTDESGVLPNPEINQDSTEEDFEEEDFEDNVQYHFLDYEEIELQFVPEKEG